MDQIIDLLAKLTSDFDLLHAQILHNTVLLSVIAAYALVLKEEKCGVVNVYESFIELFSNGSVRKRSRKCKC